MAREVGQESWRIFGQLAAQRAAPLNEVTKRCLRWRDAAGGGHTRVRPRARARAQSSSRKLWQMLQRSLDVTLVRMCESFEAERQAPDEELTRRQEELAFLATHDALTGLPNRTLILDRVEQMLVRSRRSQTPVAALLHRPGQLQDHQRHARPRRRRRAAAGRRLAAWKASCATPTRSGASAATSSS